jgi:protein-tyrosine phosphatase
MAGFVDVHSHMAPSGDDGVKSVEEGLELLRETAARGTAVQYVTPHVNRVHPWNPGRARGVEAALSSMRPHAAAFGLDLRLGYELSPERWLLHADPRDFRLERLDACLIELPLPHLGAADLRLLEAICERMEAAGLRPILAHPERCQRVQEDFEVARHLSQRGWLLQVNSSSILGAHREEDRTSGWRLLDEGLCDLIGSDVLCGAALQPLAAAA